MEQAVFVDESTHTSTVTSSNVNLSKTPPCPPDFSREKMRTLGTGLRYLILSPFFHDVQDKKIVMLELHSILAQKHMT